MSMEVENITIFPLSLHFQKNTRHEQKVAIIRIGSLCISNQHQSFRPIEGEVCTPQFLRPDAGDAGPWQCAEGAWNPQREDELKSMYAEYQNKADQFQKEQATMSQAMQQTKLQDLQDLKKRIETFQEQAQGELQEKQEELLKPLVDKAKAAIAKVAKDNGYTYVFDSAVGALLYYEGGDDIIELVKKELKIK